MNVEQALEYLEELDIDDPIVGADVFLEPPTNENLSDEDSADEDIGGNMDNFNRNQLLANAELRVQVPEGHQDDLLEEDNAAPMDVDPPEPFPTYLVLLLVSHLPQNVSFHIYGDRFFTGLNLVHQLKMRNIGYTGTIQQNRLKDCPLDRKQKRNSKNGLERGSYDWSYETNTDILACLWIDNGPVYMLSTVDAVDPVKTVERWSAKQKERLRVSQPNLVRQYNTFMGGVDQMDQNVSQYRTGIRSKKWWFCVFSFCLDTSVQNAWQIYRIYNPRVPFLEFRRQIVQYYLQGYKQAPKRNPFKAQSGSKKPRVSEDIRYDRRDHWIVVNETRIRCAECGTCTNRKCEKCGVGLHDHCFKTYHVDS
ncbi:transposase IS4 domain-containing protein [Ditylenchus destructor]|uniref:Transposase IS4 domain-containing protein n=1 Tax=Ditylenchus destructor TaxID=166010 RepID=A0AAD4MZ16_9BILA|nr:transposase IS4 domain-containing protein [Ditylenchus destructor]